MGSIYDLENIDKNPRCSRIKGGIILINLVGAPLSFTLLLIGIIIMICNKKRLSFLTYIIIFIFCSEIMNTISKMLQLVKYAFDDTRMNNDPNNIETPRGIICQIQIVISIFSDFCSLLFTLLLSYRSYEVYKNKKRLFDTKKSRNLSFFIIILISIVFSISFLLIDRAITKESITYKFDLRDRCSYWCWLDHTTSLICYSFYFIILVLNTVYAFKTNFYLKKNLQQLKQQNENLIDKNKDPIVHSKRISEIELMKYKSWIYPIITIVIWSFLTLYRIIDDSIMFKIDKGNNREEESGEEEQMFDDYPGLKESMEIFLCLHTIISAIKGIFYGFSFIIFEDNVFKHFFREYCCKCCIKNFGSNEIKDDEKENEIEINRVTINSKSSESDIRESNEDNTNF